MRVLVTGAHGFIGTWVTKELLSQGHEVLAMDHKHHAYKPRLEGVDTMLGDVRDETAVFEAAAHVDGIVHLAAVLGTAETIDKPKPAAETNVLGSLNVFEAANRYGLPVSYAAVGNAWMRSHGGGTYTITKSCAEDFCYMFNKNREGLINVVRPMNAYGPSQSVAAPFGSSKVRKIMPSFICRALCGQPVEIYGDGTQISDIVWIGDVAKAFVYALLQANKGILWSRPAEIGPVQSLTVNTVATMVINAASELTGVPARLEYLPMRRGEVPNAIVNADPTSMTDVGIDPQLLKPVSEGIIETVAWFHSVEGSHWNRPQ